MKYVTVGILALQKVAIFEYNVQMMMMMVVFIMKKHPASSQKTCWKWEHYGGFLGYILIGSSLEEVFWKWYWVNLSTFKYLYNLLGPVLKKKIHLRDSILVEYRVAIILYRLGSGNILIMIANLFELRESTTSEIVRGCCKAIRVLKKWLVFKKPSLEWMKKIAIKF